MTFAKLAVVDGAAAGTKMTVPGLTGSDAIKAALAFPDVWAANSPVDALATLTRTSPAGATGTLTIAGNPTDGQTISVNDRTYTYKTAPTSKDHIKITAGDNTAMAVATAAAINAMESARDTVGNQVNPEVKATPALGVVTLVATTNGVGSGPVVTEAGAEITLVATDPGEILGTCAVSITDVTKITVNGVQFSAKTVPAALDTDFAVKADATAQAAEIARIINAYQNKTGALNAVATAGGAVVHITAASGRSGNSIKLSSAATGVTASGAYLAGGVGTVSGGAITSTLNLSAATLVVYR